MKVKFLRNTVAAKTCVRVGDVSDLAEGEAKFLINIGCATLFTEEESSVEEEVPSVTEAEEPPKATKGKSKKSNKTDTDPEGE